MITPHSTPVGNPKREAVDSLRGYVYQIYQSALAWIELQEDEFLYLEVAEDYAILAKNTLIGVQVKETASRVTINSDGIIASIDSFVEIQAENPSLNVSLRYLTTSIIGKEKSSEHRIGDIPTLVAWRNLAKMGDLSDLRKILDISKISGKSKKYIKSLSDDNLRDNLLKKIHFDCGAPSSKVLKRLISSKLSKLIRDRGGVHSQTKNCTAKILLTLLELSTNKSRDDRFVDCAGMEEQLEAATQVVLNKSQFETQQQLINKVLSMSLSADTSLSDSQNYEPSPVSEILLPKVLANRNIYISQLLKSLEYHGICWISGAAGMGKTVAARTIAHKNRGSWGSVNLRGLANEQVAIALSQVANSMTTFCLKGLIIDDLNCSLEASVLDNLHYLFQSASRSDVLLIVTSSNRPTCEFLFNNGLQTDINITLTEFTQNDIEEILNKKGIKNKSWTQYTHLVSGGGHPQLAIAFIQSMDASGWNQNEFQTMDSLLVGCSEVNEVRRRVRVRLLKELPVRSRRLIERLSLKVGTFNRDLAIDLSKVLPIIEDGGIILESLIGSWVDQLENNRFSLSPLLSNFASTTLTTDEKETIQSAIADSLTKGNVFNTIDMNSALIAAWGGGNKKVIGRVCLSLLNANNEELEFLAPHLSMITLFRTDTIAFPSDAYISHMFRGVQLILLNQEKNSPTNIEDVIHCFSDEFKNVQGGLKHSMTNLLVYSKLMLQNSKANIGVNFIGVIHKLDNLLENENSILPAEVLAGFESYHKEDESIIGFMFLNQAQQLTKIKDLVPVFDFIDNSSPELRSRLLSPLSRDDTSAEMLVTGAWLNEHKNNTINSSIHSNIFAQLEIQARNWNHTELAVSCRKFQAVILDEYGGDKESALTALDKGLEIYGQTNSELVRAKAKVLYRSDDHEASLFLSRRLIESDAPLSEIEKAFLGREAAISAEKQGDFKSARTYYLYGREALKNQTTHDLVAMSVGLLADAALASWHNGDRLTCLQDFVVVLSELNQLIPDETLCTAHCHAVSRHVLLWLNQDATGIPILLENGNDTRIYPGCVSNPEPNAAISKRFILPIEMAWYMLATIENHASISAGITDNIDRFLPKGPVLEGQMQLCIAKIQNAMVKLDVKLFIEGMRDLVPYYSYSKVNGGRSGGLNVEKITYGTFPFPNEEQKKSLRPITEQYILLYLSMYILKEEIISTEKVINKIYVLTNLGIRKTLLNRLKSKGPEEDFQISFAQLLLDHNTCLLGSTVVSPRQVFELAFKVLQMADKIGYYHLVSATLLPWLEAKWKFIWLNQRHLLLNTELHKHKIEDTIKKKDISSQMKVTNLLCAILPTLVISNQNDLKKTLDTLSKQ